MDGMSPRRMRQQVQEHDLQTVQVSRVQRHRFTLNGCGIPCSIPNGKACLIVGASVCFWDPLEDTVVELAFPAAHLYDCSCPANNDTLVVCGTCELGLGHLWVLSLSQALLPVTAGESSLHANNRSQGILGGGAGRNNSVGGGGNTVAVLQARFPSPFTRLLPDYGAPQRADDNIGRHHPLQQQYQQLHPQHVAGTRIRFAAVCPSSPFSASQPIPMPGVGMGAGLTLLSATGRPGGMSKHADVASTGTCRCPVGVERTTGSLHVLELTTFGQAQTVHAVLATRFVVSLTQPVATIEHEQDKATQPGRPERPSAARSSQWSRRGAGSRFADTTGSSASSSQPSSLPSPQPICLACAGIHLLGNDTLALVEESAITVVALGYSDANMTRRRQQQQHQQQRQGQQQQQQQQRPYDAPFGSSSLGVSVPPPPHHISRHPFTGFTALGSCVSTTDGRWGDMRLFVLARETEVPFLARQTGLQVWKRDLVIWLDVARTSVTWVRGEALDRHPRLGEQHRHQHQQTTTTADNPRSPRLNTIGASQPIKSAVHEAVAFAATAAGSLHSSTLGGRGAVGSEPVASVDRQLRRGVSIHSCAHHIFVGTEAGAIMAMDTEHLKWTGHVLALVSNHPPQTASTSLRSELGAIIPTGPQAASGISATGVPFALPTIYGRLLPRSWQNAGPILRMLSLSHHDILVWQGAHSVHVVRIHGVGGVNGFERMMRGILPCGPALGMAWTGSGTAASSAANGPASASAVGSPHSMYDGVTVCYGSGVLARWKVPTTSGGAVAGSAVVGFTQTRARPGSGQRLWHRTQHHHHCHHHHHHHREASRSRGNTGMRWGLFPSSSCRVDVTALQGTLRVDGGFGVDMGDGLGSVQPYVRDAVPFDSTLEKLADREHKWDPELQYLGADPYSQAVLADMPSGAVAGKSEAKSTNGGGNADAVRVLCGVTDPRRHDLLLGTADGGIVWISPDLSMVVDAMFPSFPTEPPPRADESLAASLLVSEHLHYVQDSMQASIDMTARCGSGGAGGGGATTSSALAANRWKDEKPASLAWCVPFLHLANHDGGSLLALFQQKQQGTNLKPGVHRGQLCGGTPPMDGPCHLWLLLRGLGFRAGFDVSSVKPCEGAREAEEVWVAGRHTIAILWPPTLPKPLPVHDESVLTDDDIGSGSGRVSSSSLGGPPPYDFEGTESPGRRFDAPSATRRAAEGGAGSATEFPLNDVSDASDALLMLQTFDVYTGRFSLVLIENVDGFPRTAQEMRGSDAMAMATGASAISAYVRDAAAIDQLVLGLQEPMQALPETNAYMDPPAAPPRIIKRFRLSAECMCACRHPNGHALLLATRAGVVMTLPVEAEPDEPLQVSPLDLDPDFAFREPAESFGLSSVSSTLKDSRIGGSRGSRSHSSKLQQRVSKGNRPSSRFKSHRPRSRAALSDGGSSAHKTGSVRAPSSGVSSSRVTAASVSTTAKNAERAQSFGVSVFAAVDARKWLPQWIGVDSTGSFVAVTFASLFKGAEDEDEQVDDMRLHRLKQDGDGPTRIGIFRLPGGEVEQWCSPVASASEIISDMCWSPNGKVLAYCTSTGRVGTLSLR